MNEERQNEYMKISKLVRLSAIALCLCMILALCTSCDLVDKIREKLGMGEAEMAPSVLEYAFNGEGYTVVGVGTCYDTDVVIPETYNGKPVTAIAEDAFLQTGSLQLGAGISMVVMGENDKQVYIPHNITFMQSLFIPKTVKSIGARALRDCKNLVRVTIAEDNPVYCSIENCIIEKETMKLIAGCNGSVVPESVKTIACDAFYTCSSLAKLHIPAGVTLVESGAVKSCNKLSELTVAEDNAIYYGMGNCVVEKGSEKLVLGCTTSQIPETVTVIGASAFDGCAELKSLTLPAGLTTIEARAFAGCSGVESVVIPKSVINVGRDALSFVIYQENEYLSYKLNSMTGGDFQISDSDAVYCIGGDVNLDEYGYTIGERTCTVYCEAESKPGGWDDAAWRNQDEKEEPNVNVYWADQWEYVDGIPTLK